jgi:hypothetical protein
MRLHGCACEGTGIVLTAQQVVLLLLLTINGTDFKDYKNLPRPPPPPNERNKINQLLGSSTVKFV